MICDTLVSNQCTFSYNFRPELQETIKKSVIADTIDELELDKWAGAAAAMDSMVEENGNAVLDPLVPPPQQHVGSVSPQPQQATSTAVLATSTANLVTFIPAQNMQVCIF